MKKYTFLIVVFLLFTIINVPSASATSCGTGGTCKSSCVAPETEDLDEQAFLTCANADPDKASCCVPTSSIPPNPAPAPTTPPPPSVSQPSTFVPLAGIPGLTKNVTVNEKGLADFFNNLYKFLIGIAATLAVIEIIWGGLEIATKDSVIAQGDGKKRIEQAILGLVLVLSPVLVFSLINPSILNLSLNIPKIDLSTAPGSGGTGGGGSGGGPDPLSGCTSVVGKSGVLQIATCPSLVAANTWSDSCTWGTLSNGPETKLANGTVSSVVRICTGTQNYVFIYLGNFLANYLPSVLLNLQPLAISSSNNNNASDALQFASICSGIGWSTCMNNRPVSTGAITCLPEPKTPVPPGASGKCYNQRLSCEEGMITTISQLCSKNPGWKAYQ